MAGSARSYETPLGILVPIPPISGGGGDVGAPAAPAAPAPAAPAPSPGSAPAPAAPAAPAIPTPDAAGIRNIIEGIFTDPRLGPLAKERLASTLGTPGADPAAPVDSQLRKAFEDYQRAPDDQTAFAHLINTAVALGEQRTLQTLDGRAIDQANATRGHQMRVAIAQTVNDAVAKEAPAEESTTEKAPPPPPRHNTRQPWKGAQNTRSFQKANLPRRSGGS